ncbi:hypothetical protein HHI36_004669 [Cryptolaemus montrouzieri]|uniref:Uncharacterized protein n=1 Tax=Cryptolaemus montrouzieri TaxID=559131 RepID=A0ABD2NS11_9CUCU
MPFGKQVTNNIGGIPSVSQRNSDALSNFTILHPRESPTVGSRMGDLITEDDYGDFWSSRAEFVFATLLYCLNIGNLWRFPTQALKYGEGAFVYVYLILSLVFGIPLLFFEVAIGQYTNKGLMKVFHIVPLVEGVSLSMVFYCNTIIHLYDMIGVFNFIYFFSFVRTNAPLSSRTNYGEMCFYENRTNSLENLHFLNEVVMLYLHAFEQMIISLGLGMGPLINFGSYTTFRTPIHIDAVTVNICTMLASFLMTLIVFGAVGVHSNEQGYSDAVLEGQEYYVHVLLSKLFGRMAYGYTNVNIFLFYGAFFLAGFFASVKYGELMIQFIYSKWDINPKHSSKIVLAFCLCQFVLGCGMMSYHGIILLYWSAHNIFSVFSVMTLVALEVSALSFIYRMRNFCEDVEFMIGYRPSRWYKIVWYSSPFLCIIAIVAAGLEYYEIGVDWYGGFCLFSYLLVVVLPIVINGIYTCYQHIKKGVSIAESHLISH